MEGGSPLKKSTRINDLEEMLSKRLSGFKKSFHRLTFSPVVFNPLVRFIILLYSPPSVDVRRTKDLSDVVLLFNSRWEIGVWHGFGRQMKVLRRAIVKVCITDVRDDVFNMCRSLASTTCVRPPTHARRLS